MSGGSERAFTLLGGRVAMAATPRGLKPTTDAVMLAAAVEAGPGARVLDAGCGAGAVGLCLLARSPGLRVTGIDSEPEMVRLARRNVSRNPFAAGMAVERGDLRRAAGAAGPYDVAATNPPYLEPRSGRPPPDPLRAAATIETMALRDWIGACLRRLRPGGLFVLIHRPERMPEILRALDTVAGRAMRLDLRAKAASGAPERVLVKAVKGAAGDGIATAPPLVLHDDAGRYTAEAEAVLRHGRALRWM